MTYPPNYTLPANWVEAIRDGGLDALPELMRGLVNAAMQAERQHYLGVDPYQRSEQRRRCQLSVDNVPPCTAMMCHSFSPMMYHPFSAMLYQPWTNGAKAHWTTVW